MKYTKEEALRILENEFKGYEEYTEIIDMSDCEYPLIKKINNATGAFRDIYLMEDLVVEEMQ